MQTGTHALLETFDLIMQLMSILMKCRINHLKTQDEQFNYLCHFIARKKWFVIIFVDIRMVYLVLCCPNLSFRH